MAEIRPRKLVGNRGDRLLAKKSVVTKIQGRQTNRSVAGGDKKKGKVFKINKGALRTMERDLNELAKIIKGRLDEQQFSSNTQSICFERMKAIKTSSFCSICSGRSAEFFLKGRALISMQDCKITIDKCGDVWARSVELIDAVAIAERILKGFHQSVMPQKKFRQRPNPDFDRMASWIGRNDMRQHIRNCRKSGKVCTNTSAKFLCEAFISMKTNQGFLEKAGKSVKSAAQALKAPLQIPAIDSTDTPVPTNLTLDPQNNSIAKSANLPPLAGAVSNFSAARRRKSWDLGRSLMFSPTSDINYSGIMVADSDLEGKLDARFRKHHTIPISTIFP